MSCFKKGAVAGFAAAFVWVSAGAVLAQSKQDKVVARVNGQAIHESDVAAAASDILPQLTRVSPKQRLSFLVQFLVERYLIAEAAEKAKISQTPDFKKALAFYRRKALRDSYVRNSISAQITEKVMKDTYNAAIKGFKEKPEIRARHILVKTEKEAAALIAQIKKGADFIELAKKHSIGPSKTTGGDLGYFSRDKMVPSFSEAAFKLKKGEVSPPVKSEFGWHIIKAEDRRSIKIPPYERLRSTLRNRLVRERVEKLAGELRAKAKIEILYEGVKPTKAK
jgi:peptidyl-prolyl cis-trans isomerase C